MVLKAFVIALLSLVMLGCASQPENGIVPGLVSEPAFDNEAQPQPDGTDTYEIPVPRTEAEERLRDDDGQADASQPPAVTSVLDRASAALYLQQWKQASRYLDQAQRMAPRNPRVYLLYGDYYRDLHKWSQARAMYQRCLSLSHSDSAWARQARFRLQDLP